MTIKFYLSGGTTGAGNTDPNGSLGGVITTSEIADNLLHNLFDLVSGDDRTSGDTEYRCVFVESSYVDFLLSNIEIWVESLVSALEDDFSIGFVPSGVNSSAEIVADEDTAPTGVVWSTGYGVVNSISFGAGLLPNEYLGLWFRRNTVLGGTPVTDNSTTIQLRGNISAINPPVITPPDAPDSITTKVID